MGISVGDFAEQLLTENKIDTVVNRSQSDPDCPDLDSIDISGDVMSQILSEGFNIETQVEAKPAITEAYKLSLLTRLQKVKEETQAIIDEMTTVGMIGVNMAGPTKDPFKKKKKKKQ